MPDLAVLPDGPVRCLAETTFDRNLVVVAGAGTGKTTLLVNRFIHTLMREPGPLPVTKIVALTFTNKAALEMKVRIRERLTALAGLQADAEVEGLSGLVSANELRDRYRLSSDEMVKRARAALRDLEKAQIGTLHSFAAHLLRLYPLESGVAPNFQEDDGARLEEAFQQEWELWLEQELGDEGRNHPRWREVLEAFGLEEVGQCALALCQETVPIEEITRQISSQVPTESLAAWLRHLHARAQTLRTQYGEPSPRKIDIVLSEAQRVFACLLGGGLTEANASSPAPVPPSELPLPPSRMPRGWVEQDYTEARRLVMLARALMSVDQDRIAALVGVLMPFLDRFGSTVRREGWVTFDGLLVKARTLLRDHPAVRERLKAEYGALLVDEFQDTDPIQYEIILYVAERVGRCAEGWRQVELAPGKLFIVGDPKQSIYAFRRADLEAFDQVVQKIEISGGTVYELTTNFRSHEGVLAVVNAVFGRLLHREPGVQPGNVDLVSLPDRRQGARHCGVELYLVKGETGGGSVDAAAATRMEAEWVARMIREELLDREVLADPFGDTALRPGHIGLLFRKLTHAREYLDALRRHNIPFVTDGEKHFYRRQEVIDFVNLLRALDNPLDDVAMLGLLRSPLGALTDREIFEVRNLNGFDYRASERVSAWPNEKAAVLRCFYESLADLHRLVRLVPVTEMIDRVFSRLPVLELAAASVHGEQAVANLVKVREIAEGLAERPHLSLTGFTDVLVGRLIRQDEDSERGLDEESLDAVRVLTIHKAKGLEFPVVILAGLHQGTNRAIQEVVAMSDWSTGVAGLTVGRRCTLGAVLTKAKYDAKIEAEQRRILYVAMTRAKERLILSGGLPSRISRGSFLDLLQRAADTEVGRGDLDEVRIGEVGIPQRLVDGVGVHHRRNLRRPHHLKIPPGMNEWRRRWEQREARWETISSQPAVVTPSRMGKGDGSAPVIGGRSSQGQLVGVLAHRILQGWEFSEPFEALARRIEQVVGRCLPAECQDQAESIRQELADIFRAFYHSEPYGRLRKAQVIGREVPFAVPWDCPTIPNRDITHGSFGEPHKPLGHEVVLEGVMDLVYHLEGAVWVADYKTDHLDPGRLSVLTAKYVPQVSLYREAAARSLGCPSVNGQLIFLRSGRSVELS